MSTLTLALFVLAALLAIAFIHPFLLYPLTLRVLKRSRPAPPLTRDAEAPARIAILMCAYNEERWIEQKAENLLALQRRDPRLELFVYVDGATDRTAALLEPYADRMTIVVAAERHGKTFGMNTLVSRTDADLIVFTDANVMLADDAIERLVVPFSDRRVGCVCGHMIYANTGASATAATGGAYWRLEESIKQLESDTGSVMGADGALFSIRRALHRPPPPDIIDDMYVSLSILARGYRIVRAGDAIAREVSVASTREEFRRKIRIACQAFNVHRLLRGELRGTGALNRYKYASHKVMRWFAIAFLAASLSCLLLGVAVAGFPKVALALVLTGAVVIGLALVVRLPLVSSVAQMVVAMAGAGVGVWRSLRGERFQTWAPATSKRREASPLIDHRA